MAAKRGRPPKPDSGNYENVYTSLTPDVMVYVRRRAGEESRTLSSYLATLIKKGIAWEIAARDGVEGVICQPKRRGKGRRSTK